MELVQMGVETSSHIHSFPGVDDPGDAWRGILASYSGRRVVPYQPSPRTNSCISTASTHCIVLRVVAALARLVIWHDRQFRMSSG